MLRRQQLELLRGLPARGRQFLGSAVPASDSFSLQATEQSNAMIIAADTIKSEAVDWDVLARCARSLTAASGAAALLLMQRRESMLIVMSKSERDAF